ncbi:hypothetical protein [Pseudomonas viridiflava]|uniref:Uncharacterized protein n=2 Tax=Pseudomonas viridiflava TaxID=33069 RepID=A0AA46VYE4_PSEVI|nr:hypothetical protein [Pseudomonas viridiflava]UZA68301.1 hypothetical protein EZZ81_08740 [Pseudomonas viridiflava]
MDKLQRYPRHALGSLNPQSLPFVTLRVTHAAGWRSRKAMHRQVFCATTQHPPASAVQSPKAFYLQAPYDREAPGKLHKNNKL